jgi:hypothetical protein
MFYYYHLLLVKGIGFLNKIIESRGLKCNQSALLLKILEVRKFSHEGVRLNTHLTISIDKG